MGASGLLILLIFFIIIGTHSRLGRVTRMPLASQLRCSVSHSATRHGHVKQPVAHWRTYHTAISQHALLPWFSS